MTDDTAMDEIDAPFAALHDPAPPVEPDSRFARSLRERAAAAQSDDIAARFGDVRDLVHELARRRLTGGTEIVVTGSGSTPSPRLRTRDHTPVEPAASERHARPVTATPVDFSATAAIPYLCVDAGAAALRYYQEAFDAAVTLRVEADDGTIGHAEFRIDAARFMLADEFPDHGVVSPTSLGGTGVTIHLEVADADGMFDQALRAGGFPVRGTQDRAHGHRTAIVLDPFGHRWLLSQRIEEVDAAELGRRSPGWRVRGTETPHPTDPPY